MVVVLILVVAFLWVVEVTHTVVAELVALTVLMPDGRGFGTHSVLILGAGTRC